MLAVGEDRDDRERDANQADHQADALGERIVVLAVVLVVDLDFGHRACSRSSAGCGILVFPCRLGKPRLSYGCHTPIHTMPASLNTLRELTMHRSLARLAPLAAAVFAIGAAGLACAQARDHVSIVGSSTVFPFSTAVAENFGRQGKFKTPVVESTGTGGGFKAFCAGVGADSADINDASRPMTDGEKATCAQNGVTAVDEIRVGYDGIILAANKKSPIADLTREQVWRAVAKTVPVGGRLVANPYKNWSDIDAKLPKRAIRVFGPAPNHGTRDAFVELVMVPPCEHAPEVTALSKDEAKKTCQLVREDGAWVDVAEDYAVIMGKLQNDKEAVGAFTFSYLDQNRDKIAAAKIDGVAASLETIAAGKYPVSRPLFIYVKRAHVAVIPGLKEFVAEYLSPRAAGPDGYLADKGLIPLPKAELEAQRAIAKQFGAGH
jgi:phosphate transport system substrate-binding protein